MVLLFISVGYIYTPEPIVIGYPELGVITRFSIKRLSPNRNTTDIDRNINKEAHRCRTNGSNAPVLPGPGAGVPEIPMLPSIQTTTAMAPPHWATTPIAI